MLSLNHPVLLEQLLLLWTANTMCVCVLAAADKRSKREKKESCLLKEYDTTIKWVVALYSWHGLHLVFYDTLLTCQ